MSNNIESQLGIHTSQKDNNCCGYWGKRGHVFMYDSDASEPSMSIYSCLCTKQIPVPEDCGTGA